MCLLLNYTFFSDIMLKTVFKHIWIICFCTQGTIQQNISFLTSAACAITLTQSSAGFPAHREHTSSWCSAAYHNKKVGFCRGITPLAKPYHARYSFRFLGRHSTESKKAKMIYSAFPLRDALTFFHRKFPYCWKKQIPAVRRKGNDLSSDCKKEISFFLFAWLVQNLQTDWNLDFLFYPFILQNIRFAVSLSKLSAESRTGQLLSCKWEFLLLNNCFAALVFIFTDSIFLLQNTICKYRNIFDSVFLLNTTCIYIYALYFLLYIDCGLFRPFHTSAVQSIAVGSFFTAKTKAAVWWQKHRYPQSEIIQNCKKCDPRQI